jgi:L-amino acid N-acyltransferase YncA
MAHEPTPLVRPATPDDIPQVYAIYSHYVLHTPTDMHHSPPTLSSFTADYHSITSLNLPYLIAVTPSSTTSSTQTPETNPRQEHPMRVLGFVHAFPFRGTKAGYAHTAELAIMCAPDATKRGVGSALMESFLRALREGRKVEQVLAFMTVLEDEGEDRGVRSFYEKWGFREAGRLAGVGRKFGRR